MARHPEAHENHERHRLTPEQLAQRTEENIRSGLPGQHQGLTAEDGREHARRQTETRSEAGQQDTPVRHTAIPADSPMSVKLEDVVERNVAAFNPDDLAVVNASVVDLQAYEALLVAPPAGAPVNVDVPVASQTGDTLTCTMGNWDNEPSSYAYQWAMDGIDVGTANDVADYVVTAADAGKTASCVVWATNAVGSTAAPPSNGVVIADPSTRAVPAREA